MPVEVTKVEVPEKKGKPTVDSPARPKDAPVAVPPLADLTMGNRERLLDAYNQYTAADAVKAEEVAPPVQEHTDSPPDAVTEKDESVEEDTPPKEQRTVSYGALKEEREKRKAAQSQIDEMNKQIEFLIGENRLFMDMLKDVGKAPGQKEAVPELPAGDSIEDYDRELITHRKTIQALKKQLADLEGKAQADTQKTLQQKLQDAIVQTNKDLETEGYRGFEALAPLVQKELYAIGDPKLDTPEGWKKVYKERIFPAIYGKPTPPENPPADSKMRQKEDAAKTRPSGGTRPPQAPARSSGMSSFEEYMAERRKNPTSYPK